MRRAAETIKRTAARIALGLALLCCARPAPASAGVDLMGDFASEYVFRGATQRQGASIQPSLRYSLVENVQASFWANLRLENSVALSETDYSLQWSWLDARPLTVTIGGIHYSRTRSLALPTTSEAYFGVDLDVDGAPSLYVFYDFDSRPGAYWDLSFAHRFLTPDYRGTIDLAVALGWDTGRVNGFHDARCTIGFSRRVGEWRLQPSVDLHFPSRRADPTANNFRPVFRFSASRSF